MLRLLALVIGLFPRLLSSRRDLLLENLALRQQLMVFKRRAPRPKLGNLDKLFWVVPTVMAPMEASPLDRLPGDSRAMASRWIPSLLELDLAPPKSVWPETHQQRNARFNLPHGSGEPDLGRSTHSW